MSGPSVGPISEEDLARRAADKSRLYVAGMAARPGVRAFVIAVEHRYFDPRDLLSGSEGPRKNDLLDLFIVKFVGMHWFVMGVPMEYKRACEAAAADYGLRLADGVPTEIEVGDGEVSAKQFPMRGDNVWTLEQEKGSELYQGLGLRTAPIMQLEEEANLERVMEVEHERGVRNNWEIEGELRVVGDFRQGGE